MSPKPTPDAAPDVRIPLILILNQAQGDASVAVSKLFEALGR